MSLKGFHLIFIIFSILLTLGFGIWAIYNYGNPPTSGLRATAAISFLLTLALSAYCVYFVRKLSIKI
jgi:hypothetical protein